MYWQLSIVALIVLAAVVYLARQTWRAWRGSSSGCGGGCPKCTSSEPAKSPAASQPAVHIPVEQLTLRRR